jgi:CheY-like chemotaxis protein
MKAEANMHDSHDSGLDPIRGKRILLVDDDVDMLELVAGQLRAAGADVTAACGEREGEDALLTIRPDLVILDLMMERKDSGFVLCHRTKQLHPGTPVILLTAVAAATGLAFQPRNVAARSWIGADLLLDKPVPPERLRQEVKRLLTAVPAR